MLPRARWERRREGLEEDTLWGEVRPTLADLALVDRELGTVGHALTEMVNDAFEHSRRETALVTATAASDGVLMEISDDGIGVFRAVRGSLQLPEDVEAVFVLTKAGSRRSWTDPETMAFDRTRTIVRLAGFGVQLLSRSEARRVTIGLERFRHVTIDFRGVELVGQGFCDEVFRVFAAAHPHVVLDPVGMSESVAFMVERSRRPPRPEH